MKKIIITKSEILKCFDNSGKLLQKKINEYGNFTKEEIYLIYHGIEKPLCEHCGLNHPKFINFNKGFYKYCSSKCSNNSIETQENKKKVYLEKFGTTTPFKNEEIKKKD